MGYGKRFQTIPWKGVKGSWGNGCGANVVWEEYYWCAISGHADAMTVIGLFGSAEYAIDGGVH